MHIIGILTQLSRKMHPAVENLHFLHLPVSLRRIAQREQMRYDTHMKAVIFMGSPRQAGNTAALCRPFMERLALLGWENRYITLADKHISPCRGYYVCQDVSGCYGCAQKDDMQPIVEAILSADLIVLATPVYTWYCPAEMKAMLDRLYGMNKYYGTGSGSLWRGKCVAILATHGYAADDALTPFATGVSRLCTHSALRYCGAYSVRDENDLASFQTEEAIAGAQAFAETLDLAVRAPV